MNINKALYCLVMRIYSICTSPCTFLSISTFILNSGQFLGGDVDNTEHYILPVMWCNVVWYTDITVLKEPVMSFSREHSLLLFCRWVQQTTQCHIRENLSRSRPLLFWDVTWCILVIIYRRIRTTYRSHLQGRCKNLLSSPVNRCAIPVE